MSRRRFTARDAIVCVAVAALLLVVFQGPSIRDGAEDMKPGWERTLVLAAAKPAGWVGDRLPFAAAAFAVVSCGDVLEHIYNWDAVIGEVGRVLARGGVFFYDTINRTLFSKLVLIKLAQDWPWTRVLPPRLHAWERFITPAELRAALARHGLEHRAVVGGAPPLGNPLRALRLLRQYKAGALSAAAFGRRMALRESRMLAGSYMGYAVKP